MHVSGLSFAQVQSLMSNNPEATMMTVSSTTSAGNPGMAMGHVAYDITTNAFDPEVFTGTTMRSLQQGQGHGQGTFWFRLKYRVSWC